MTRRVSIQQATCHPDRKLLAKGLCTSCYNKQPKELERRKTYNRKFVNSVKATCHPDRPHSARGLCKECKANSYMKSVNGRCRMLLNHAKARSLETGQDFDLELSDIQVPTHCPLLGIPLDCAAPSRSNNLPSLDRIDSSKGYTKSNTWVISWRANRLKRDATLSEILNMAQGLQREILRREKLSG